MSSPLESATSRSNAGVSSSASGLSANSNVSRLLGGNCWEASGAGDVARGPPPANSESSDDLRRFAQESLSGVSRDACNFALPPTPPSPGMLQAEAAAEAASTGGSAKDPLDTQTAFGDATSIGPECVSVSESEDVASDDSAQRPENDEESGSGVASWVQGGRGEEAGEEETTTVKQLKEIIGIALPVAMGNLSEYLPLTFGMVMVGQLPGAGMELDALAMANSYFNITGLALQYGLNSALRTLCPQAVGSGRSRELNGIYVQRGVVIACVALLPSLALAMNAQRILILLGQPPDLALLAQQYCVRLQPALAGIGMMTLLQRVMQAEGHIMANFYICLMVFACAPLIQYAFIHTLEQGFLGAAYASSAYNLLYLVFFIPYMNFAGLGHIFIPRKEVFSISGMRGHLSLALPGFLFMCVYMCMNLRTKY